METKTYTVEEMLKEFEANRRWWKEIYYWGYRLICSMGRVPYEIKWFVQRGRRGYSDRDVWSFYWYLAWVISNGVKQLREEKNGCPEEFTEEGWDRILDKISNGFGRIVDAAEGDSQMMLESLPYDLDVEEAKQLFVKHFESLWD